MTAPFIVLASILAQQQNPSPMVEHTREHPRIAKSEPAAAGRSSLPERYSFRRGCRAAAICPSSCIFTATSGCRKLLPRATVISQ